MMRRIGFTLFALLALPAMAFAQRVSPASQWDWHDLEIRTTTAAASVPAEDSWIKDSSPAFADSLVFRKGPATRTLVDTTVAFRTNRFWYPPTYGSRGAQGGGRAQALSGMQALPGGTDSSIVDTTDKSPWIAIRVRQDTTSYSFTGSSGDLDSMFVGAQISYDGINWLSVSGSPTRAFIANPTGVSGTDGLAIPCVVGIEPSVGADVSTVVFEAQPSIHKMGNAFIINRTLCAAGAWVRFIIGINDATGQWRAEIAHWGQ